jgi:hypothetical protein
MKQKLIRKKGYFYKKILIINLENRRTTQSNFLTRKELTDKPRNKKEKQLEINH